MTGPKDPKTARQSPNIYDAFVKFSCGCIGIDVGDTLYFRLYDCRNDDIDFSIGTIPTNPKVEFDRFPDERERLFGLFQKRLIAGTAFAKVKALFGIEEKVNAKVEDDGQPG